MKRALVFLGASALLLSIGVGAHLTGAAQQATPPANEAILVPGIDIIEAQEIALAEFPDSMVQSVELDRERGGLVYDVDLTRGDVELDAMTGAVLYTDQDD